MLSQASTIMLKRRALSTLARSAGVVNAPKALVSLGLSRRHLVHGGGRRLRRTAAAVGAAGDGGLAASVGSCRPVPIPPTQEKALTANVENPALPKDQTSSQSVRAAQLAPMPERNPDDSSGITL